MTCGIEGDGAAHWTSGQFVFVPSLGMIAFLGTNQPISTMEFYVQPHLTEKIPGLQVHNPFRGRLEDKLDFGYSAISRQQVESHYGVITSVASNQSENIEYYKAGRPFCCKAGMALPRFGGQVVNA